MLYIPIILFIISAVFGLVVLTSILRDQETPKPLVYAHGAFAVTALALVIYYSILHPENFPLIALGFFVVAALGGVILFVRDILGKTLPKWLAVIHPIIASTGLVFLIFFAVTAI